MTVFIKKLILDPVIGTNISDVFEYAKNIFTDPRFKEIETIEFEFNDMVYTINKRRI